MPDCAREADAASNRANAHASFDIDVPPGDRAVRILARAARVLEAGAVAADQGAAVAIAPPPPNTGRVRALARICRALRPSQAKDFASRSHAASSA